MNESDKKKELNPNVLKKLQFKIFSLERDNHKTKKLSDYSMVQQIRKTIDELVRSEDNL